MVGYVTATDKGRSHRTSFRSGEHARRSRINVNWNSGIAECMYVRMNNVQRNDGAYSMYSMSTKRLCTALKRGAFQPWNVCQE